jgi:hypothetical protein
MAIAEDRLSVKKIWRVGIQDFSRFATDCQAATGALF